MPPVPHNALHGFISRYGADYCGILLTWLFLRISEVGRGGGDGGAGGRGLLHLQRPRRW
jgi:hypothetical protein